MNKDNIKAKKGTKGAFCNLTVNFTNDDIKRMVKEFCKEFCEENNIKPVVHAHWIDSCGDVICSHCNHALEDSVPLLAKDLIKDFDFPDEDVYEDVYNYIVIKNKIPNYCPHCGAKMDEVPNDGSR